MALKQVTFVDSKGRKFLRGLPEHAPEDQAEKGIPLGPPPLDSLGLPIRVEVALNNALFDRGIYSEGDARARFPELISALTAAYRADAHRLLQVYQGGT